MPSAEVAAVLEAAGADAGDALFAVESRLSEVAGRAAGRLGPFVATAAADGGKRLRPLLAVLSAGTQIPNREETVRAGVAVELVHAATLVHDDVLDGSDARRGKPTVVAAAGREMATAAGDWLFAAAFGELVDSGAEAVGVLAQAGSDLARGELLQRADAWNPSVTRERYFERCRLKTARLFEAAAELGSRSARLDPTPAIEFASAAGIAFQLLDDVLDVTGPQERTGKPRGTDLIDGTVTLPLIIAMERDPSLERFELRGIGPAEAAVLCDRIEATGAATEVRELADSRMQDALSAVERMAGVSKAAFRLIARALVDRVS